MIVIARKNAVMMCPSASHQPASTSQMMVEEDLIIVLLRGGYTRFENTLFEDGKWVDVRNMRHAFQDTMEGRFTEAIERLSGREVAAFMSASHQRPDLQIEVFVLDGPPESQAPTADNAA